MLEFSVTFLITIVNITFLFLVLRKVLFGRVTKFMEDRSNKIQRDIDLAKLSNERAKTLEAEYAEKLKASREEGQRIIQIAREKSELDRTAIIAEAKVDHPAADAPGIVQDIMALAQIDHAGDGAAIGDIVYPGGPIDRRGP